jgi:hypothetical protein
MSKHIRNIRRSRRKRLRSDDYSGAESWPVPLASIDVCRLIVHCRLVQDTD